MGRKWGWDIYRCIEKIENIENIERTTNNNLKNRIKGIDTYTCPMLNAIC